MPNDNSFYNQLKLIDNFDLFYFLLLKKMGTVFLFFTDLFPLLYVNRFLL